SGDSISYGTNFVPEASATISESIPQEVRKSASCEERCSVAGDTSHEFREEHWYGNSSTQALGDDQGNVVVLLVGTEAADFLHHGGEQLAGRKVAVAAQGCHQALFAELLPLRAEGFGDSIGVEREGVAG